MANNGNFLEYTGNTLGIDVGFGKLILVYPAKKDVGIADLSATAINAEIVAGTIVGVIKGWVSIAGAPVGEISVERTATAEMHLIRAEIPADTFTFQSNMSNAEVLADLVKAGSLNCVMIDDQGNVFGDYSPVAGKISTMLINFSSKVTTSFQRDLSTEKTIAITARYLVTSPNVVIADTETELVESKTLVVGQLSATTTFSAVSHVFVLKLTDKSTGKPYAAAILAADVTVIDGNATVTTAVYVQATGLLTITLTGTGLSTTTQQIYVTLSGDDFYMKETLLTLVAPA